MPLDDALHDWEERVSRAPQRQPEFRTSSLPLKPLYTPLDLADQDFAADIGYPGDYPFTRGIQPTMYRGRLWTMRQYAGFGTPAETNERFSYLLSQGQTGLSIAFDLPTQTGYDSDHVLAEGEVGKVGVAISSLEDMSTMLAGIPLDKVSTSMTINAPAAILLTMYQAVAEAQGVDPAKLDGTTQNDILKEYVARGTYIYPPGPSLRLAAELVAHCAHHLPRWNPISVSGYHIRDAGSTAAQEMAFALANAIAYVEAVIAQGVAVDKFAPRISWIFNTHNGFFEEVAKYRALRRLWAKIMRERFGAQDPRSWMLRTHTQTGGSTLTAQQPANNIVRAGLQALAAALGGVQSMALSCYDEALAIPTEQAQEMALRTQQIVAYETGVADTVDPLAGSYLVESLTSGLEQAAQEYIERIASLGGAVAAIERGFVQREIQEAAYRYQRQIESGGQVIVGVNRFGDSRAPSPAIFRSDPGVEEERRKALQRLRAGRDGPTVAQTLRRIEDAARAGDPLMPPIMEAVKTYATLGEICDALRAVYGEYRPPTAI